MQIKYISVLLSEIYNRKTITYNGFRLKSIYLIDLIDLFLSRHTLYNSDKISINSLVLKKLYGGYYNKYVEYLIDKKIIYLYKDYSVGLRSKTYKLTDKIKQSNIITINVKLPKKLKEKTEYINLHKNDIDTTIKEKIVNDLYKIDIDLEKSEQWINENIEKDSKSYLSNLSVCKKIKQKDIYYSFDSYGRFHTNYTVLKKHIRENYLSYKGYKLKEIDITNSQPFFLYLLMKKEGFVEFQGFDKDVLSGVIYDKIAKRLDIERKEVKVNIYSVLFGRNMTQNFWNDLFDNLYPNVYKWIREYKKKHKNYKIIAQLLQKTESDFIFKSVIPQVMMYNKDLPLITIHDSIMVPELHYEPINEIFNNLIINIQKF